MKSFDPFSYIISEERRFRDSPKAEGVFEISVTSSDSTRIEGWAFRVNESRGTLFLLHGFCDNCGNSPQIDAAFDLSAELGLSLVAHDSRHHGKSEDRFPSFGTAEMWDFKAVINKVESLDFPKPYIAIGDSLGAMVAQRAAIDDIRITGAFLMQPPGWPMDAIGVCMSDFMPIGGLATPIAVAAVNSSYKWNILADGDIRRHHGHPEHEPLILYIMGGDDHYGIEKTRLAYEHWYSDDPDLEGYAPCQELNAKKWFVEVPGAGHPGRSSSSVVDWPGFRPILKAFVKRCMASGH